MSYGRKPALPKERHNIAMPDFTFLCGLGTRSLKVADVIPNPVLIANDNSICATCYLSGCTFFLFCSFGTEVTLTVDVGLYDKGEASCHGFVRGNRDCLQWSLWFFFFSPSFSQLTTPTHLEVVLK